MTWKDDLYAELGIKRTNYDEYGQWGDMPPGQWAERLARPATIITVPRPAGRVTREDE